jgi:hypothetical protein
MRKLLITLVPAGLAMGLGAGTAGAASPGVQSDGVGSPVKPTYCVIDPVTGQKKCWTTGATASFGQSTGVGAGKITYNPFSITKKIDK